MIGNALLGQFLSIAITLSGAVNEYLYRRHAVNFPALQTVAFYLLLTLVFLPKWLLSCSSRRRSGGRPLSVIVRGVIQARGWTYCLYAMLDCVAALLVIRAYNYTNLAVIALLSTISTPCVIVLSRIFLATRYKPMQYLGAAVCVAGIVFFSVAVGLEDSNGSGNSGESWWGGLLALASALLYAGANVIAERVTTSCSDQHDASYDSSEFLALTGAAGLAWALLGLLLLGRHEPALLLQQPASAYPLIALYVLAIFGFYAGMPVFIRRASATFFNLSLLTVNIYSALVNMVLFQDAFTWSFPTALLIVTIGILIYSF